MTPGEVLQLKQVQSGTESISVNYDRVRKRLIELCVICSPSRNEKKIGEYLAEFSYERSGSGLEMVQFPPDSIPEGGDTSNLLIRIPGKKTGDVILLSAHMDTVPVYDCSGRKVVLSDGLLKTDGGSVLGGDDKTGIAAALEMADLAILYPEYHAGIEILFTVQEELGCRGSASLDRSVFKAGYGYNLDGETPPGSIIVRAPRKAKYMCEVHGISSHAALAPEEGVSALKIAGKIIDKLPQGQVSPNTTANIGSVSGGGQTNIIPEHAVIKGELRSFSSEEFDSISRKIENICNLGAESSGGGCKVVWEHSYSGYSVDPESVCIKRFSDACRRCGVEPGILGSPGGGDSNNFNSMGIENVVFGLGMHNIHSPEEYVVLEELYTAVEILKELIFCN